MYYTNSKVYYELERSRTKLQILIKVLFVYKNENERNTNLLQ